jgi:hypothetical protein
METKFKCKKNLLRYPLCVSPNQGLARRPMRGRLEAHLDHLNIQREAGGIVWVNPSSKCASCHSNEMHQRIIQKHVNVSSKAYVYDETIYNSCARARFAGCTYLRHIILALNTVLGKLTSFIPSRSFMEILQLSSYLEKVLIC